MSRPFVVGIVAAIVAVMVLGGALVWAVGGAGTPRAAALEESKAVTTLHWFLYGGTGAQTFWADLESVAGCDAQGEVATGQDPGTGEPGKVISGLVPSACRLKVMVNSRVHSGLYAWINDALAETHTRRNLTLLKKTSPGAITQQELGISLEDALIERIELPPFQADGDQAVATITLTVRPEQTTRDSSPNVNNPSFNKPAPARTSSYDVNVNGQSLRPIAFEPWGAAVAITRNPNANELSEDPLYEATQTSLGDLGLSISLANSSGVNAAQHLHTWFEDFVIDGQGQERPLTLTARDPATGVNGPALLTVNFTNVGIFAQPSYALGVNPEKFLFYAETASFAGPTSAAP